MDKVHAQKNSFSASLRYRGNNRNISLVTLPSAICQGISLGCTPISLTGWEKVASPGTRPVVPVPRAPPGYLTGRDAGDRISWVNHGATIIRHKPCACRTNSLSCHDVFLNYATRFEISHPRRSPRPAARGASSSPLVIEDGLSSPSTTSEEAPFAVRATTCDDAPFVFRASLPVKSPNWLLR